MSLIGHNFSNGALTKGSNFGLHLLKRRNLRKCVGTTRYLLPLEELASGASRHGARDGAFGRGRYSLGEWVVVLSFLKGPEVPNISRQLGEPPYFPRVPRPRRMSLEPP